MRAFLCLKFDKYQNYFIQGAEMKIREITEDARIVKNVNTTCDVDVDEIKVQAAKFGFDVSVDGYPALYTDKTKLKQEK